MHGPHETINQPFLWIKALKHLKGQPRSFGVPHTHQALGFSDNKDENQSVTRSKET